MHHTLHAADPARLRRTIEKLVASPVLSSLLESLGASVLVLNSQRQIVALSHRAKEELGNILVDDPTGLRLGEAIRCPNSKAAPGGCGTSKVCPHCGVVLSVLAADENNIRVVRGCSLGSVHSDTAPARDYEIHTSPIEVEGEKLLLLTLQDVTDQRRREQLERIFFHDVANTLTALRGWAELLHTESPTALAEPADKVLLLTRRLQDEVSSQHTLSRAERGELNVTKQPVDAESLLEDVRVVACRHRAAHHRQVVVAPGPPLAVDTDPTLLVRVLVNMVVNALEAEDEGATVRLSWERLEDNRVRFAVHNPSIMPDEVARRIFQRSFSTKASKGRGLGTFSMKLLGERYLGGVVQFESAPETGTVFSIVL